MARSPTAVLSAHQHHCHGLDVRRSFFSYAAEFLLIVTTRGAVWLPVATYSPLGVLLGYGGRRMCKVVLITEPGTAEAQAYGQKADARVDEPTYRRPFAMVSTTSTEVCPHRIRRAPLLGIDKLLGLGDEVDNAFRRYDEMVAAKPYADDILTTGRTDGKGNPRPSSSRTTTRRSLKRLGQTLEEKHREIARA